MTDLALTRMTADAARALTETVKAEAEALWAKLLDLYEGEAHLALGYSSWGSYFETEFSNLGGRSRAYQLLDSARVVAAVSQSTTVDSAGAPRSEGVARELAPVLRQHGPEVVRETWQQTVAEHGDKPTAAQVKDTARRLHVVPAASVELGPKPSSDNDPEYRWLKLVHGLHSLAISIRDIGGLGELTETWEMRTRDQFLAEIDYLIETLRHVKEGAA